MRNPADVPALAPAPVPTVDLEAEADLARCGALKDHWYVACLSSELTRRAPLARTFFGTNVVLFRDERGQPVALRDRCLHRNARLSAGAVFDGRLGCPYHGWVYDGSGAVVEVPSLGPSQCGESLDARGHARAGLQVRPCDLGRLQRFDTLEQDGLVFVFPGGDSQRARRPAFRVPFWGQPEWSVYFMVTRFPNGVTNLVENFMDVPHTVFVHAGWFRDTARKRVPATVKRSEGRVLVTYKQAQDTVSGLGRLFNPSGMPMVHTDHFISPNVTRVDYLWGERSGFVINSQITPIGPMDSLVYTAISYRLPYDLPRSLVGHALQPLVRWYTTQVITQDVDIMRVQREGLLNGPGGGVFSGTEADLLHSDIEAYRRWLREGGQGAGPPDAERDIAFWI
ncbi:aromatic ring-hydroxylating oxygenase subunit alpha [Archangium primigenium]|uniref:aromatic ring-hydroxylating oxygenase subunit alpha n=1 Tax=[Archangium] primigenium TaxID=2792470 RepID=UPI00195E58F5|nr:aromatic ring-hydroxylating dioxygenase subunit alpha [Archangium primigenium]MBM7112890.1 aromatic ring-hydroxylating dioxygenase subunit alpha [Archangium primigenium]